LATVSYAPARDYAPVGHIADLRALGRIRVGVDENTQGLSARNPLTGEWSGFEVDLADLIAQKILGDSYTTRSRSVQLVPLDPNEKWQAAENQTVDMTISAVTMLCSRWQHVDLSSEYYTTHQQFLMRRDSGIHSREDLAGRTVCVTSNSTSETIIEREVPKAVPLPVAARTDCLLALQQGEADAYFGHETFLYGLLKQDATVVIREDLLDPEDTVSHYGIAINRQYPELTRAVNKVLQDLMADGTWRDLTQHWLVDPFGAPDIEPPLPDRWREPGD